MLDEAEQRQGLFNPDGEPVLSLAFVQSARDRHREYGARLPASGQEADLARYVATFSLPPGRLLFLVGCTLRVAWLRRPTAARRATTVLTVISMVSETWVLRIWPIEYARELSERQNAASLISPSLTSSATRRLFSSCTNLSMP